MQKIKKWMKVCPECGFIGKGKMQGSLLMELFLFLMFIIPWVFYYLWRGTQKKSVCPKCGCKNMIPVTTPRGKKLVEEYGSNTKTVNQQLSEPIKQIENNASAMSPLSEVSEPQSRHMVMIGIIFGWFFGIMFVVFAIAYSPISLIISGSLLMSSMLILPPLWKFSQFFSPSHRILLAFLILIIGTVCSSIFGY